MRHVAITRAILALTVTAMLAGCKTVPTTADVNSPPGVLSLSSVDRGSFGSFRRSLNERAHGYAIIPDPTGAAPTTSVERFEVRPGDCSQGKGGWNDCANDRERSELSEVARNADQGNEFWYGWSLYVPEACVIGLSLL